MRILSVRMCLTYLPLLNHPDCLPYRQGHVYDESDVLAAIQDLPLLSVDI